MSAALTVDAGPSQLPNVGTCFSQSPTSPQVPASPSPRHQVQRSEEEVHQLSRAGILDVLPQLGLGEGSGHTVGEGSGHTGGGAGGTADKRDPIPHVSSAGRAVLALTSRLKASLVFWKQSTNSASEGGRARSVRTPSGWGPDVSLAGPLPPCPAGLASA